jgi:hypothetical protein
MLDQKNISASSLQSNTQSQTTLQTAAPNNHSKKIVITNIIVLAVLLSGLALISYLDSYNKNLRTQEKIASILPRNFPDVNQRNVITTKILNSEPVSNGLVLTLSTNILKIDEIFMPSDSPVYKVLRDKITVGTLNDINSNVEANIVTNYDTTHNLWIVTKIYIHQENVP